MENQSGMKRGQTIAFRIPQDTPDHILKELSKLKEKEKRNFSAKIAGYVIQGVNQSLVKDKETITIPLPRKLTKVQHDWLKHEHSEAMLGSIVYELIQDPLRATSLFAALSKQPVSMDDTLFLQEDELPQTSGEADPEPVQSGGEPPVRMILMRSTGELPPPNRHPLKRKRRKKKKMRKTCSGIFSPA